MDQNEFHNPFELNIKLLRHKHINFVLLKNQNQ